MKYFIAIIKPFKLDDVRNALTEIGVEGLTASEVRGFGRQRGQEGLELNHDYSDEFHAKIKIEIIVENAMTEKVIKSIKNAAYSGKIGDGKIFVSDIEQVIRIRTGEKNSSAI